MGSILKMTARTIRSFFGRYLALLLIVSLSVSFFAGLKVTKDAMYATAQDYLDTQNFCDFRLISTLGFSEDDVETLSREGYVGKVEGMKSVDVLIPYKEASSAFKLMSITEQVNLPALAAGRMPQTATECLADARAFDESDLGTVVTLSADNDADTLDLLETKSFLIVGLANSPLYLSTDRGTTTIGDGALKGFLLLHPDAFSMDVYTEVDACLRRSADIYSSEYDGLVETYKPEITKRINALAWDQYDSYLDLLGLDREHAEYVNLEEPDTYVLTRQENAGFVSFQNDTAIVSAVANLLPVFFIMIALLVCITTMTRMVSEERTQIGVLKAMGFHSWDIAAKYLLYALSATFLGWLLGFFLGTWALPEVFWWAYGVLYKFAPLKYTYSQSLAMITLGVSLVGILGATLASCQRSLRSVPAELIRPQRGKSGKRILLEYIPFLWKPLSFLQKITLRNMLRYKLRMTMMLVGIGCCTALMVTAFGVRDSMLHVGNDQFGGVQHYALSFSFTEGENTPEAAARLDGVDDVLPCIQDRVDVYGDTENMHSVTLIGLDNWDAVENYWTLSWQSQEVPEPGAGEALVSRRLAEKLALSPGDTIEVEDSDLNRVTLRVAGVFENYVGNYLFVQGDTCRERFGNEGFNAAMLQASGDLNQIAKALTELDGVTALSRMDVLLDQVDSAMSCLNYIIWLVVGFAWALAFIVIYNLTNINLAERSREIATVEVLGFYPRETAAYVLRENLVLSFLAAILGLPLGKVMHGVVMSMVMVDNSCFNIHIERTSYIAAFVCTVLFAWVVGLVMRRHIRRIPMAESLKAVE